MAPAQGVRRGDRERRPSAYLQSPYVNSYSMRPCKRTSMATYASFMAERMEKNTPRAVLRHVDLEVKFEEFLDIEDMTSELRAEVIFYAN